MKEERLKLAHRCFPFTAVIQVYHIILVANENGQKQADDLGCQFTEIFIKEQENVTLLLSLLEGLLLLQHLTKCNAAIQKIVAFENAFERLLDIITEEGNGDGGIVVEDCLLLLLNLLKNNSSNQNFFKEGSYIQRMKPWFEVGDENSGWSAQKVTNLHLMLQLVRVMVSPVNPPGATSSCQKSMYHCGLLQQLCTILMATGVPADILTETINTVSEVIRGSQCFLYKNQKGQGEIVATLLPSTIDANSISAGQLLCGGLFSTDSVSNWCAAVALAHALQDNLTQKEQLLRVQLATSLGNPPVSLLQQCTNILSQGSKVQTRVGLLMLLCTWINNCPIAVTHFLHNQANIPFVSFIDAVIVVYISQLTGQISENLEEDEQLVQGLCALLLGICIYYNDNSLENYTKEKLKQLIEKRIGKENFVEKLGSICKHELYSRAAQKPQPVFSSPEQMLFDHEFTKLVKDLEAVLTKTVHKSSEEEKKEEEVKKTLEQHDSIVTQYKELIREQDSQQHNAHGEGAQVNGVQSEELSRLWEELEELKKQHGVLQSQLAEKDSLIEKMKSEGAHAVEETVGSSENNSELQKELETLRAQVQSQSAEISQLQAERQELLNKAETLAMVSEPGNTDSSAAAAKITELEKRLSEVTGETEKIKEEGKIWSDSKAALEQQVATANSSVAILQNEKSKLQQEVAESKKEQDDLLMLLADQDQKIKSLKDKLKELGEPIEEDDDLDTRDQYDDEDDEDDD
ncbi:UNVERIFIED_CONTAM: hypothetical protein FKN15_049999 [Acipenser sinensis]